jgi:lycopene beta-cyclase
VKFDFAILGGGAAGLSLALELVRSPLKNRSILIVEKEAKDSNDRTWCYWTDKSSFLDGIVYHRWPRLHFASPTLERTWELSPLHYLMVRGIDFYHYAHAELAKYNVTFLRGAGEVKDGESFATVRVNGEAHQAEWAFDSRILPGDMSVDRRRYHSLNQHFTGWTIEAESDVFDPSTVTLFDLRTPQRSGVTFFYVLPFSPRRALVEYTLFSAELLPLAEYEAALQAYLSGTLQLKTYAIEAREHGVIPMTDKPFLRRRGKRILAVGTLGGRVKPSTGYAFDRIQLDSQRIVRSLADKGHPFSIPADPLRRQFYDATVLDVLECEPERGRWIFSEIFAKNPADRVLNFLGDRSSLWEDLQILASPDPGPFIRSIFRLAGRLFFLKS